MKETTNANIGTQAFTIDQDAYEQLRRYLDDIRSRLPEEQIETMEDIELRIAEIFRDRLGNLPMRVVTIGHVCDAMAQMGTPADFGERCSAEDQAEECPPTESRRLYRSRTDRSIGGVCGGLAEHFGIDPTLVRLVTLLLILFGGLSFWIYVVLWIVIPEQSLAAINTNKQKHEKHDNK